MEIMLAKTAGFCFGVKRALDCVYKKLKYGKIYTYGPIIHNKSVTEDLKKRGVEIAQNLDNIGDGELIIRSHGVGKAVYDMLENKAIKYTDCTCPFVKKIHNIVNDSYKNENRQIIIIGNAAHPEVMGINGWCDNTALIFEDTASVKDFNFDESLKYAVVVQTTFQKDVFNAIIELLPRNADIKTYNTICNATNERQKEAVELAKKADKMLIFGDRFSSNTRKLFEISKKINKNTFLCETIADLELNIIIKNDKIGITAGASTPPSIIKEAIDKMSEMENQSENQSFEEMLNESMVILRQNEIVKGKVIRVTEEEVFVDLQYKHDGIITKAEFSSNPNINLTEAVKVGDEIEVYVLKVNDGEGNVLLSKKKIDSTKNYEEIEEAYNNKSVVTGKVVDVVKGGLIILINDIRAFVPSSQVSNKFVSDLSVFKGKQMQVNIIEIDRARQRVVAGRKELAKKEFEEKRNKVFESIKPGDRIEGTVSRIVDFGAFVDLGGVDGLIHISEMSWGRIKKVSDVLSEGDKVTVTVLDVNVEKGKISLSLKDASNDPWRTAAEKYAVGSIVEGKVVRMVAFGAFVELEDGIDGLVHISQISQKHVVKPDDVLSVGQVIKAKVTDLDTENKKISLSIKDAEGKIEETAEEAQPAEENEAQ